MASAVVSPYCIDPTGAACGEPYDKNSPYTLNHPFTQVKTGPGSKNVSIRSLELMETPLGLSMVVWTSTQAGFEGWVPI